MAGLLSADELTALRAEVTRTLCDTAVRKRYTETGKDSLGGSVKTLASTVTINCRVYRKTPSYKQANNQAGVEPEIQVICSYGQGLQVSDTLTIGGITYRVSEVIFRGANAVDERYVVIKE